MPVDTFNDPAKPAKPIPGEIGDTSGIAKTGIVVNKDYNAKLSGSGAIRIYDKMRLSDATVKAVMSAMKLPILSTNWYIREASQKKQDIQIAEWLQDQLIDDPYRPFREALEEILLFLDYGRMPFEIVWNFDADGLIRLKKLASRTPESIFSWKLPNNENGVVQYTVNGNFEIPMEKMCIFVLQKEGDNWEGISVLRTAYKHWYMKDKMYYIDAVSAERQGLGIPFGKYPSGTTEDDIAALQQIVRNMRTNEKANVVYKDTWEVGIIDMKGGQTKNVMQSVAHHDRQIAKNVLAQFLDLGAGKGGGSYALSKDQSELFILTLDSIANYVATTYNRYVIKKLVDFNYIVDKQSGYPKLCYDPIDSVDANILSTAWQRLVQVGAVKPQPNDEDYFRGLMGMPEKDELAEPDENLGQDILNEVQQHLDNVSGEQTPTTDESLTPEEIAAQKQQEAQQQQQADYTDDQWLAIVDDNHWHSLLGGPVGVPLSEETKRKISEALNKGKGKGKGKGAGKGKGNPHAAEIAKINQKVQALKQDAKEKLLEMKAKGQKMSPQDTAKFQLDLLRETKPLMQQIQKLKAPVSTPAVKATEAIDELRGRIDDTINKLEASLK